MTYEALKDRMDKLEAFVSATYQTEQNYRRQINYRLDCLADHIASVGKMVEAMDKGKAEIALIVLDDLKKRLTGKGDA